MCEKTGTIQCTGARAETSARKEREEAIREGFLKEAEPERAG